jgi:hypothetical protein
VNENVFYKFVRYLYTVKYLNSAENELIKKAKDKKARKDDFTPRHIGHKEVDMVVKYLTNKQAEKQIPTKDQARVYARMLEWTLSYFYNGYRGLCIVPDPLFKVDGMPYYGWEMAATETALDDHYCICHQSAKVSPAVDFKSIAGKSLHEQLRHNLWEVRISISEGREREKREKKRTRNEEPLTSAKELFDAHDAFLLSVEMENEQVHKKARVIRAESIIPILSHTYANEMEETPRKPDSPPRATPWITIHPPTLSPIGPPQKQTPVTRTHLGKRRV